MFQNTSGMGIGGAANMKLSVFSSSSASGFEVIGSSGGFVNSDIVGDRTTGNLGAFRARRSGDTYGFFEINPLADRSATYFNTGDGVTLATAKIVLMQSGNVLLGTTVDNGIARLQVSGSVHALTAKLTNLTDGYYPKHTSDAIGLENGLLFQSGANLGLGYTTGTEIANNKLAVSGSIHATDYKKDNISLLLDVHKSGSLGTSGQLYVGAGATTTPTWQSVNTAIGGGTLATNTVSKWDGIKFASITNGTEGQVLKMISGVPTFAASSDTLFTTIAISDELTDLTTGTAKVTFRMPISCTLTKVRASVTTASIGANLIFDINENGTSVLSTKLSIDDSEKTSLTATSQAVISDSSIANDAEITIDIDQIGSTIAGKGAKIILYYIKN